MELNFRGLIAPVFAPFKKDKSLNLDVIEKYAKYLKTEGIDGVLVNGTSGEGMSMTVEERKLIAKTWMSSSNLKHVMVQIGGAPLPDVIELAKHAEHIGAHSILCLPDLYTKPANSKELIRYLQIISKSAPKTPLLYYHIPMFTHVNIHMGEFLNEIVGKVPTFCGIKFTSNCLDEGIAAVNANNKKFTVFLGADTLMLGAYALGFNSAIATSLNMFPKLGLGILENFKYNLDETRNKQEILTGVVSVITKYGKWVPSMKAAMNMFTLIDCGPVRDPLESLTESQAELLYSELKDLL